MGQRFFARYFSSKNSSLGAFYGRSSTAVYHQFLTPNVVSEDCYTGGHVHVNVEEVPDGSLISGALSIEALNSSVWLAGVDNGKY